VKDSPARAARARPRRGPDRSTLPPLGAAPEIRFPPVAFKRLDNGIEILCIERHSLPLVDLHLLVRAGSAADAPLHAGRASLVTELLEEGAGGRSGLEIADTIDRMGAEYSTRTGADETALTMHALAPRTSEAIDLLADLARVPSFPDTDVRRRREERLAALLQERDEPAIMVARLLSAAVYGADHPYGMPARGTPATIGALDRDTLVGFHAARYRPDRAFLIVVGDVDPALVFRHVEDALGEWSDAPAAALPVPAAPASGSTQIVIMDRPGAPQSEVRVGCVGAPRLSPDYDALVVLNTILGGTFTSRLNLKLREEKGFTYGARSSFSFRSGPGPFTAGAAVHTEATAETVAIILNEVQRLREEAVTDAELERALSYLVLGLPRRLETGTAIAAQLAELHLHGLPHNEVERFVNRVLKIDAAAVRSVAVRFLDPARMTVAIVGDVNRIREPLEQLAVGGVRVATQHD
jgi:zinc protease